MKRMIGRATVAALGVGGTGAGAERTLFIKSKDTKQVKEAKLTGTVVQTLQPGAEVTWKSTTRTKAPLRRSPLSGSCLEVTSEARKRNGVGCGDGRRLGVRVHQCGEERRCARSDSRERQGSARAVTGH